jgi:hypothetical protein
MAQRTSFEKLQRDRAKKAKAANKREKRQERGAEGAEPAESPTALLSEDGRELTAAELLTLVEELHRQYAAEEIDLDEFDERKTELLQRIPVD